MPELSIKKLDQKNIITLIKNKHNYDAYLEDDKKIVLTSQNLSSILRNNMISNKRYVILNTSNFNDKKLFIHSKLDLENSVNGSVTYSNGIFFEIDEIKKKININQNDNKDWVFF